MNLIYDEPLLLNNLVVLFNSIVIYLVFLIPLFVLKNTIQIHKIINNNIIFINVVALSQILIGYYLNSLIIPEILILYLTTAIISLKIKKRSIKWTNFSYLIFMLAVIFSYVLFLFLISNLTTNILEKFNIVNFTYEYKDFFHISFNDTYHTIKTDVLDVENNILYKKLYLFYYVLLSFALSFWLFLYKKSLEKHNIKEAILIFK